MPTQFLADVSSSDKTFDDKKRLSEPIASLLRQSGYEKRAHRCERCGNFLGFQKLSEAVKGRQYRLAQANFCKDRVCPMCQWRRSLAWKARYWSQLPKLQEDYPSARFLFLTLTVKNPSLHDLRGTINQMNKAFAKLTKRKQWPALGYHKALEITLKDPFFPHPHFHILMMVSSSYFGSSGGYVSQARWVDLWQSCLRVPYAPSVRVSAIKPDSKVDRQMLDMQLKGQGDGKSKKSLKGSVKEVVKYVTKSSQVESLTPEQFQIYTEQIKGCQTQAMGGVFRDYFKDTDPDDLVHVDEDKLISDSVDEAPLIWFTWNQHYRRYMQIK